MHMHIYREISLFEHNIKLYELIHYINEEKHTSINVYRSNFPRKCQNVGQHSASVLLPVAAIGKQNVD